MSEYVGSRFDVSSRFSHPRGERVSQHMVVNAGKYFDTVFVPVLLYILIYRLSYYIQLVVQFLVMIYLAVIVQEHKIREAIDVGYTGYTKVLLTFFLEV